MVVKPLTLFLILFCLVSSVFTVYQIQDSIEITSKSKSSKGSGTSSYQLLFSNNLSLDDYIKVKISKVSSTTQNLLILISGNRQCDDDRKSMGVQTYESINLFFLKEHARNNNGLYLCVKCQSEDGDESNCNYNIDIDSQSELELNIGEQISYYVEDNTQNMFFKIINDKISNLRNLEAMYDKVNFWIKGQDVLTTKLTNSNRREVNRIQFGYGFMHFDNDPSDYYSLSVTSKKGDFVTVGSLGIIEGVSQKLRINDLEIMGILNSDLNYLCFPLELQSEPLEEYEDLNVAQINGIIYTKKASIYTPLQGYEGFIERIEDINDGLIFYHMNIDEKTEKKSFCVTYREEDENKNINIIFSLQFTSAVYKNYDQYIIPPQLPGVIYSRFLPKGAIGVYRGMKVKNGGTEINYNMKSLKGFPDMYFNRAIDFPEVQYRYEHLRDFDNPHHANRMSVYNFYLEDPQFQIFKDFNNLTPKQPLIIVYCLP